MSHIRLAISLTAALTLVVGLTATVAAAGTASLRLVNAQYPTLSVDLYIDGSLVFSDVRKGEVTDPVKITTGSHDLLITPAGDPTPIGAPNTFKVSAGAWTMVTYNPGGGTVIQPDDTETVAGSALLRIWEVSYSLGLNHSALAIVEAGKTLDPEVTIPNPTEYLQLDPGAHTLKVLKATTGKLLFTFAVDLESDTNYTVFIYDVAGVPHAKLVVDATTVSNTAMASRGTDGPLPVSLILLSVLAAAITIGTARISRRSIR
jgi:hypothetical protein